MTGPLRHFRDFKHSLYTLLLQVGAPGRETSGAGQGRSGGRNGGRGPGGGALRRMPRRGRRGRRGRRAGPRLRPVRPALRRLDGRDARARGADSPCGAGSAALARVPDIKCRQPRAARVPSGRLLQCRQPVDLHAGLDALGLEPALAHF
ncbi:hypothetical protein EFP19_14705 [Burkholderia glumae]|nr:hypothetical protein EFP19_14705 [Burkholderia glumae]